MAAYLLVKKPIHYLALLTTIVMLDANVFTISSHLFRVFYRTPCTSAFSPQQCTRRSIGVVASGHSLVAKLPLGPGRQLSEKCGESRLSHQTAANAMLVEYCHDQVLARSSHSNHNDGDDDHHRHGNSSIATPLPEERNT